LNPWIAKAAILAASIVMVAIRAPHGNRSRRVAVARSHKGGTETALLTLAWAGFVAPLIWVFAPSPAFGDYPLRPVPFVLGVIALATGLWLFHRSHSDLGTNWSITLEVREQHRLIANGVYRRIRHPMYASLFLYSIGQALVLPNWIAGPSYLIAFGILFLFRFQAEERMMRQQFGAEYESYAARTKRLVPGVW
jgi:protein-S-isoprenylcysteine O-methyltransferase Ste14